MRELRLSVFGFVVLFAWCLPASMAMTGGVGAIAAKSAGAASAVAQGAAQPAAVANATPPFTTEVAMPPHMKLYWDGNTLRIDMGPQTITGARLEEYNGTTVPAVTTLLVFKTRRLYTVVPSVPSCLYDVVPPGQPARLPRPSSQVS